LIGRRSTTRPGNGSPDDLGPSPWTSGTLEVNAGRGILDATAQRLFAEGRIEMTEPGRKQ